MIDYEMVAALIFALVYAFALKALLSDWGRRP
jgi:hypothetical protein